MKDQLLQIKGFQFLILEELITDKLNGLAPYVLAPIMLAKFKEVNNSCPLPH